MRIPSGVTDQYIYFVAVDATDLKTRETGLTGWTVYYSRNGGAAATFVDTIAEVDATNMPGVYSLELDDATMMTIASGNDSEEVCVHIEHDAAACAPVTRTFELYRPKITAGQTLTVSAGAVGTVNALAANTITSAAINDAAFTAAKFDTGVLFDKAVDTVIVGTMNTDVLNAGAVAANAVTEIQSGLATAASVTDLSNRIPAALASGRIVADVQAVSADTDAADSMEERTKVTWWGTVSSRVSDGEFSLTVGAGSPALPTQAISSSWGRWITMKSGNNYGEQREVDTLNVGGATKAVLATNFGATVANGDEWVI